MLDTQYRKVQKMTFALLIAIISLFTQFFSARAASLDTVQVRSAPLAREISAKNGMVRVYLSSLGNPSVLNLTIKGRYSLSTSGEFISDGSNLTVLFSAENGRLTLRYQDRELDMGKGFSLRRHSSSGANGILIAQSRDSQNPYPGDLSFEVVPNGNTYSLYTIAHVNIENYLYGVLPYEMGNSSGQEALKAQAVAARTYTVRMMDKRSSNRYDVKDTTSDQVYRGTPSGNANCFAAVDATKGIVLMDGANYVTTYYSASNGGQTETSRNGTTYGYMKIKDDPFDYANPSATVKKKTIHADLNNPSNPAQLMTFLKGKAISSLQKSGYLATADNTSLLYLHNITPHTPMYAPPSRLYTKMDFTIQVSSINAAGRPATANLTITCDIFDELENLLGLGIQSMKNELWSVEKGNGIFSVQSRRYGHGMGMSQRGAMYMDKLGYTYDQILGFYYDGCKRVEHSFTNRILSAASNEEQITVESPAELENNTGTECIGIVTLSGTGSELAIRSAAVSDAQVLGSAGNGAVVSVLADHGKWVQIKYGEIIGYVPSAALVISGTPSGQQHEISSVVGFAKVTANDFVNLRQSAGMNGKILGTAPSGAVLTVLSLQGDWAKVQYQAMAAYVNRHYVSEVTTIYPSANLSNGTRTAVVVTAQGTGSVNLRQTASMTGKLVARLPVGAMVAVQSDDGSWCSIISDYGNGYMLAEFLQYQEEEDAVIPPAAENTPPAAEESALATAVVDTEYGALNMRALPKAGSKLITTIPKGSNVLLMAWGDLWSAVRYNGYEGYVMSQYLKTTPNLDGPAQNTAPSGTKQTALVITPGGSLNLRSHPRTGSEILARIPQNTMLSVIHRDGEWCEAEYMGTRGFVMSAFLDFEQKETLPPSENDELASQPVDQLLKAIVATQSGSLNLRKQPSVNAGVLASIPRRAEVDVAAYGDEWCAVRYGTHEGYAMTRFLQLQNKWEDPNVPETPENEKSGKEDEHAISMWVMTSGGSLNLRSAEDGHSKIVTSIPHGKMVSLLEQGEEWSYIRYGEYTGFVMTNYLSTRKPAETSQKEPTNGEPPETLEPYVSNGGITFDVTLEVPALPTFALTAKDTVLYEMCSESSSQLCTAVSGERVEILLMGELWCRIDYQDVQGYCLTQKLSVIK